MVSKRVSAKDKVGKDSLFKSTVEVVQDQVYFDDKEINGEISKFVNNKTKKQHSDFKRQTYFLTEDLISGIAFKSVFEKRDKSEIVREALKAYIENKYFNMNKHS